MVLRWLGIVLITCPAILASSVLSGRVIDPFGAPVSRASVRLLPADTKTITDSLGRYRLAVSATGVHGDRPSSQRTSGYRRPQAPNGTLQLTLSVFNCAGRHILSRTIDLQENRAKTPVRIHGQTEATGPVFVQIRDHRDRIIATTQVMHIAGTGILLNSLMTNQERNVLARRGNNPDSLLVEKNAYRPKKMRVESDAAPMPDIVLNPEARDVTTHEYDSIMCGMPWPDGTYEQHPMREHYVSPDEDVQSMIVAAKEFDIISLSPGRYLLDSSIVMNKPLILRSVAGPEATIIDGQNHSRCFLMTCTWTVLDGFTVTNGDATGDRNWGYTGREYLCDDGGGVFTGGCLHRGYSEGPLPVIRNCLIVGNKAGSLGGGGMHLKGGYVQNCLIAYNWSVDRSKGGGIACKDWSVTLENCTVSKNNTGIWVRQQGHPHDAISLVNCIVTQNGLANWIIDDFNTMRVRYSLVGSDLQSDISSLGIDTAGLLFADPGFVAPADTNFALGTDSPARDRGQTAGARHASCTDMFGAPRVNGSAIDMGPFESPAR